jgi:triacylglycerol lipase
VSVLLGLLVGLLALVAIIVVLDRAWPRGMSRVALRTQRALGGFKTASIPIPGFDITYLDGGRGEPLVLVHGIGADKDHFAPIAPYLRGLGRIVALDLPGFGDSTKTADADYSIEMQVERLGQFLDALELPRVHLGGSSLGGAIVLAFALRHPERVQSLWLLAPAGVGGAQESEMFRRHRELGEYALFAQTPAEYARVMAIVFARPPFVPYCVRHELTIAANRNYALHTASSAIL